MRRKIIFFLLFFAWAIFYYSLNIEPNKLVVRHYDLFLPHWSSSLNGMKVVVVGDLHIGTRLVPLKRLQKIVDMIKKQEGDLVLILGDFDSLAIQQSKIPTKDISDVLSDLSGSYAVLGNHDYRPSGVVGPILKSAGIKLLIDDSAYVYFNNTRLRLCGINDIWHYDADVEGVLGKVTESTIFLSHNPDVFPEIPETVALTISGHTHGGEVSLPFLGAPFVPSIYGQKYSKGYIIENNKHLFVTSGIACLSRLRFFNPPEIVVLNLYASDKLKQEDYTSVKMLHKIIFPYNSNKYGKVLHRH